MARQRSVGRRRLLSILMSCVHGSSLISNFVDFNSTILRSGHQKLQGISLAS
jgi:hypothetical protein